MRVRLAIIAALLVVVAGAEGMPPQPLFQARQPSPTGSPEVTTAPQAIERKGRSHDGDKAVAKTTQQIMAEPAELPKKMIQVEEREFEPPAGWRRTARSQAAGQGTTTTTSPSGASKSVAQTIGSTNFLGVDVNDSLYTPPDSMGAVGPSQFLLGVNGRIRTFTKAGSADGKLDTTLNQFFSPITNRSTTDPRVRYDRATGRWFVTAIDVPAALINNKILIAVSNGSTITSATTWHFFTIAAPSGSFADFDTLGIDEDALYIGANLFNDADELTDTQAWVVTKSSVLSTGPIHSTTFGLLDWDAGIGPYSPEGVDNLDTGTNQGYFIGIDGFSSDQLDIVRVNNPGAASPTLTGMVVPTVATGLPAAVSQPSPGPQLDGGDLPRLGNAVIRKGRLWTSHSMEVTSTGNVGAGGREGVRWYELQGLTSSQPTVNQTGLIYDPSVTPFSYWMSSVMVSGQGHAAFGFSRASTDGTLGFASAAMTGRLATDTLGATDPVTLLQGSTFLYNDPFDDPVERWGDYSYTSVDPSDDMTMWTVQEYASNTDEWGVRVVQLKAPAPTITGAGTAPVGSTTTPIVVNGTGFFEPGSSFPNHLTVSVTGGVTVKNIVSVSPTEVVLNASTTGASAGNVTVTVTNPDGQTANGTASLTAAVLCTLCHDFDLDGGPDILLHNTSNARNRVWFLDGVHYVSGADVSHTAGLDWELVTVANINSDTKPDILLHNKKTGKNYVWFLNGTSYVSGGYVGQTASLDWQIVGMADFNNDTKPDILLHNKKTGKNYVWFLDGTSFLSGAYINKTASLSWVPVETKDFNGDTKPDILWRNSTTGVYSIWFMNGISYVSGKSIDRKASVDWVPMAAEDFSGDGKTDVLLRNAKTGAMIVWFLNENHYLSYAYIDKSVSTAWRPV